MNNKKIIRSTEFIKKEKPKLTQDEFIEKWAKKLSKLKKAIIGTCGVDSGQLLIIDPCYLSRWKDGEVDFDKKDFQNDYDEACKITDNKLQSGIHSKSGVVFQTGYGDGAYPIKATYEKGRIKEINIKFF